MRKMIPTTPQTPLPTDACIILTYRCQMRCQMCNIWKNPSRKGEEFSPDIVNKILGGLEGEYSLDTHCTRLMEIYEILLSKG